MRKIGFYLLLLMWTTQTYAQEALTYQTPPKEILDLVDVSLPPQVLLDDAGETMILLYRDRYKRLEELSEEEVRLAGLRINPKTNIGSRVVYYTDLKLKPLMEKQALAVEGLPENPQLSNFTWSPKQDKIAFTHTTELGVALWVLDIATRKAKALSAPTLNANLGRPMTWFKAGTSLLVKMLPEDRQPLIDPTAVTPTGPIISESTGEKARNRTYQDLLQNKVDEANFEQLAYSTLYKVDLDGTANRWREKAMYRGFAFSPNGAYVLLSYLQRPFSYLVPYYRFPSTTLLCDAAGKTVKVLNDMPLLEEMPRGMMSTHTYKRGMQWRSDAAATVVWAMALDGGDPAKEVEYRDEVFAWAAPFTEAPTSILKLKNRFSRIYWGNDNYAIAEDYWWNTRNQKTYVFAPGDPATPATILFDRNYQDRYSAPGNFAETRNAWGKSVLALDGSKVNLLGAGYTKEGQFPFIDVLDLKTQKKQRVYQSSYTDKLERIYSLLDAKKGTYLVRIESATTFPNYYVRTLHKKKDLLSQVSFFENPFKSLQDIHKEVITYKREDGLELSATLYLPVGYDKDKKEKMPMVMWAYPREYKDKKSAGQVTSNPNAFTYPYYGSMVYWVTQGYVVLDDAAFPIVGEGEEEPNDSFRKQLVGNAKAAIDAVDALGYIDRNRVAVGGHSYGAFMTANLLSHSNLFAAGIARSGAYNRTLTPFGFQSEERSYWEAPNIYNKMSPFMHADKMNAPLLLVHGEADNNSGTYPLQSKRYFNALKGLGATARLVILPKESHGYRAKASILHLLWEQHQWLEKYVKNKK